MIKYMKLNTLNFEMVLLVIVFIFPVLTLNSEDYSAPIIQPGMPGSPSKILDADEATKISNSSIFQYFVCVRFANCGGEQVRKYINNEVKKQSAKENVRFRFR